MRHLESESNKLFFVRYLITIRRSFHNSLPSLIIVWIVNNFLDRNYCIVISCQCIDIWGSSGRSNGQFKQARLKPVKIHFVCWLNFMTGPTFLGDPKRTATMSHLHKWHTLQRLDLLYIGNDTRPYDRT